MDIQSIKEKYQADFINKKYTVEVGFTSKLTYNVSANDPVTARKAAEKQALDDFKSKFPGSKISPMNIHATSVKETV